MKRQGRRPKDIDLVNRHYNRKQTRMTLRQIVRLFTPRWDRRGLA